MNKTVKFVSNLSLNYVGYECKQNSINNFKENGKFMNLGSLKIIPKLVLLLRS